MEKQYNTKRKEMKSMKFSEEMLEALYSVFLNPQRITRKILHGVGLSNSDITTLLIKNDLVEIAFNSYALRCFEDIMHFARKLAEEGNTKKANQLFEMCEVNSPKTLDSLLLRLHKCLLNKGAFPLTIGESSKFFSKSEIYALYRQGFYKHNVSLTTDGKKRLSLIDTKMDVEHQLLNLYIAKGELTVNNVAKCFLSDDVVDEYLELNEYGYYIIRDFDLVRDYGNYLKERDDNRAEKCLALYEYNLPESIERFKRIAYECFVESPFLSLEQLLCSGLNRLQIKVLIQRGFLKVSYKKMYLVGITEDFMAYIDELKRSGRESDAENCLNGLDFSLKSKRDLMNYRHYVEDLILDGIPTTKQNIVESGLSLIEVEGMIYYDILVKNFKEEYVPVSFDSLLRTAMYIEKKGDTQRAYNCYRAFLSVQNSNISLPNSSEIKANICVKIGIDNLLKRDYELAFRNFKRSTINSYYETIFNFYAYLLSFLVFLPSEDRIMARKLAAPEINMHIFQNDEDDRVFCENLINQKFNRALRQFKSIKGTILRSPKDKAIASLLYTITRRLKALKENVESAIVDGNLHGLRDMLLKEISFHKLNSRYSTYLSIADDVCTYEESGKFGMRPSRQKDSMSELINAHLYSEALEKSIEFGAKKGIDPDKNYLSILLSFAIERIKLCDKKNLDAVKLSKNEGNFYNRLLNFLTGGNLSGAELIVENRLENLGMTRYSYIVYSFIDISFALSDMTFMRVIGTMRKFEKGTFMTDVTSYYKEFSECINQGSLDAAREYIDLVKGIIKHGDSDLTDEETKKILTMMEVTYKSKKHFINNPVDQNGGNK